MAIAFDAVSVDEGTGTRTWSHTCSGSDRILFVGFFLQKNPDPGVTSVTYNGVAMTKFSNAPVSHQTGMNVYMYYLIAPATGTNNIVLTPAGAVDYLGIHAVSYTGVKQTGFPDSISSTINSSAAANITLTTTTVADNSWLVGFHRNEIGGASDGANTTHRGTQGDRSFFDSNGAKTPAGSYSLIQNFSSAKSSGIIASIAPSSVQSNNFLSVF